MRRSVGVLVEFCELGVEEVEGEEARMAYR
jgi:hypothetical protein